MGLTAAARSSWMSNTGGFIFSIVVALQLLISAVLVSYINQAQAAEYTVGNGAGWTIPAVGSVNYTTWAAGLSLVVGDVLSFRYDARLHDVMEVGEQDYDTCNTSAVQASFGSGKTNIHLDRAGMWYFICGVPGHCAAGQKLAVQVLPPPPPASPSPTPAGAPPAPAPSFATPAPSPAPAFLNAATAPLSTPALSPSPYYRSPRSFSPTVPSVPVHHPSHRRPSSHQAALAPSIVLIATTTLLAYTYCYSLIS